jgi:hypothetical protein
VLVDDGEGLMRRPPNRPSHQLPIIAVVTIVTVVTMPVYSQHAPGATDDTTCHTTDDATNSRTDRTGCVPTLSCAAHNALGLRDERH